MQQNPTADMADALRIAIQRADPNLSRFDPLPRIISHDDFSRGHCGWSQLVGNYEGDLDTMLPGYAQHTAAMLSTLGHWDAGSHGGMDSSYALKIATRPRAGARNVAIKRHTFRKRGPIRFEVFFTFKPEASELALSETDVRSVGFVFDLGAELCIPGHAAVQPDHVSQLDAAIAHYNADLGQLTEFILPGGSRAAALAHVARSICRRAERSVVALQRRDRAADAQFSGDEARQYLNRLSDLCFVLARALNKSAGTPDVLWQRD